MENGWLSLSLAIIGTLCWAVCFIWMYQISSKQNRLLDQLGEQGRRIERLSEEEHQLIREVHPQVGEIRENIEDVRTVLENTPHLTSDGKSAQKK